MLQRLLSSIIFAAVASLITYLFSAVFYNYSYALQYLVAIFLFMFIAGFLVYPLLVKGGRKKDKPID